MTFYLHQKIISNYHWNNGQVSWKNRKNIFALNIQPKIPNI